MSKEAIEHLRNNQQQMDFDGVMVGVSRQALDETLDYLERLEAQLTEQRSALIAAEESLVTYAGVFGYPHSGKLVLKQVREALAGQGGEG